MPKRNEIERWLKSNVQSILLGIMLLVLIQACLGLARMADSVASQSRLLERLAGLPSEQPSTSWIDRSGFAHVITTERLPDESDMEVARRHSATLNAFKDMFPIR